MQFPTLCARITGLGLCLAAGAGMAAPVGRDLAALAAQGWLQRSSAHLGAPLPLLVDSIQSHQDAGGRVLYHEVRLAPEGFVILAGDDELEPVVAFSDRGSLDPDPESHLALMLERDLRMRLDRLARERSKTPTLAADSVRRLGKWQALAYQAPATADAVLTSVSDLRVAPLTSSLWSQATVNRTNVYNYYTPNHYVCGCVATAMAQLMRFHTYPTTAIGIHSFTCKVDGTSRNLATRGGDGAGGAYAWTNMPLVPANGVSTSQAQQIGDLCYDAAVSVKMSFANDGSGAYLSEAATALAGTFKYANSVYGNVGGELVGHGLNERVQPNLDAGLPVILGISGTAGGHAIVCDGYGYSGGTLYHHLNMGWAGSDNAWYQLPDIASDPAFNLIDDCVFNIFPSGTGELLSGRVTDPGGAPVAGVTVTDGTHTSTTNANGIYALKGLTQGYTTISASQAGHAFPQAVRHMGTSSNGEAVGNLWGVDLVRDGGITPVILPAPASQEVKLGGTTTFSAGATGQGPLHFAWTKNGSAVGTDSPALTLSGAAESDDQASIGLRVIGSQGQVDATPVTLSVTRLFNGSFEYGSQGWTTFQDFDLTGSASYYVDLVAAHGGSRWLCLGDWSSAGVTDFASQSVDLPAQRRISLGFWMGIGNSGTPGTSPNTFRVLLQDAGGQTLATLGSADSTAASVGSDGKVVWKAYGPYDLTAYAGRTVTVRFESTQPGGSGTGTVFALDDVSLSVSSAGALAAVSPASYVLPAGGQASFRATVTGSTTTNQVDWTISGAGGTFAPAQTAGDGSATAFTAGTTPGAFTVTATPVETPGTAGTASVTVVDPATVAVNLTASATTVLVNAPVTLNGSVSLLTDASLAWTCTGGAFTGTPAASATWSAAAAGTYTVTAASTAVPSRSASKVITVVDPGDLTLAISPAGSAILLPGTTATFTASGDQGYGVAWSMTPSFAHTDNGLATQVTAPAAAPLATATYTLTAASLLDASRKATVTVLFKGVDLNADGKLDPMDLLRLAAEWGKDATSGANLKGSGTVGDADLAALLDQIK